MPLPSLSDVGKAVSTLLGVTPVGAAALAAAGKPIPSVDEVKGALLTLEGATPPGAAAILAADATRAAIAAAKAAVAQAEADAAARVRAEADKGARGGVGPIMTLVLIAVTLMTLGSGKGSRRRA